MDTRKKVLMIANQFPPMGGSGVQRTSKFVKYLPAFGYEGVVLTRDDQRLPIRDESLLSDIPAGTEVIRTPARDYSNLEGLLRIPGKVYSRWILVPDAEILWAKNSFEAAMAAIKKHDIKIIYSTSYPYSDHLLALKIKKTLPNIFWVADFRDEWTNNPYTLDNPHNAGRMRKEKQMEAEVLHAADQLISNTPVMVRNFVRLNGLSGENFHCIPNGYDKDDFEGIAPRSERNPKFTLTYTGALYGRRRPDTFFTALSALIQDGKVDASAVDIRLIGKYAVEKLNADIDRYGLRGIVHIMPYMPHKECLKMLAQSDGLLLIEGSGRGSDAFYTGKVFEYMMSKAAVLAIIPKNGAAAGLVEATNIGKVADFDNIDEIKSLFMLYYTMWQKGENSYAPNYEEIAKYERKELTKKLSQIFDSFGSN